ncbi:hypothetical protein [Burkholderia pyrrocinia]
MNDMSTFRRSADAIERRVQQLEPRGVRGRQLVAATVTFLPDLERIWVNTTDAQLAELCRDYPVFYRYASAMEEAAEADRRTLAVRPKQFSPLPEPLKTQWRALLQAAATLEMDYQRTLEVGHPQRGPSDLQQLEVMHQRWMRESNAFATRLRGRDVPDRATEFLIQTLTSFGEHLAQVAKRSDCHAGLASRDA